MSTDLLQRRYKLLGKEAPLFYQHPLHIVKGEGVWLYDSDDKQYLDVYNNVPNVGHCHPKVVAALSQQAAQLNVHNRYLHENIVNYGEKLLATMADSLDILFLCCSGSEANELALRMCRQFTGKQGIICSNATYHGNTTAVDALATLFNDGKPNGPNVASVDYPNLYRPLNDLQGQDLVNAHLEQIEQEIEKFEQQGSGFAGLIFCPLFANEGLPNIPDNYLQAVAQLVHAKGGLLIFDEVQSGFGRSGNMWGHQHSGVEPDIMTLGKPMGNGHPLAAAITSQDIGCQFREHTMYFNTFGGNPVSCAVGEAVLDVMEQEQLPQNAKEVGDYLQKKLASLAQDFCLIGDIRHRGLFFAVELVLDKNTKIPATDNCTTLVNRMKERGVLISAIGEYNHILKMRPPLCFSRSNADLLVDTLRQCLLELEA